MRHCTRAFSVIAISLCCALVAHGQAVRIRSLAEALAQQSSATVSVQRVSPAAAVPVPATTVQDALRQLTDEAAVIFARQVSSVKRAEGVVEIRWAVEDAIRGVAGTEYVQREWAGLWQDGDRYRVGEHALVMLHAPSVAGFSTPVSGLDGVVPLQGDAVSGNADLRWVMTHVVRADSNAAGGVSTVRTMRSLMQGSATISTAGVAAASAMHAESASDDVSANEGIVERSTVVDLVRAWVRQAVQQ